ncbi:MAG: MotA/TolQ/ExbB proton channel family protein [Gemmatimonadetes bacterium]|nr:MotA/TolQ/ExbB proton channel family protein [Gemmatimonadota bacterium]
MVALILTILMQQLFGIVVPVDTYLYRLFRPDGGWGMSVVPGLIAFALIWTLTDLMLKYWVGRTNKRDLARPEVAQLPLLVRQEPTGVTLQRLRAWDRGVLARPVGRRLVWLMSQLNLVDAQRAHELLRHQSDLDADTAASSYRTVKLFIWAMPILGFIGTVLGISLAVGGFSDFLTAGVSIEEIETVTAKLGEVAGGLSFAFDTTLLGLLAGLIATMASSGVQDREERMLTGLDELGLMILANATSASVPSHAAPSEDFDGMMRAHLGRLSEQMEQFTRAVRSGLDGLDQASARMSSGLAASIGSVTDTVEGLGDNLKGVSETLARGMTGLGDRVTSMEEANQSLGAELASSSSQVASASERLLAGVQSQAGAEEAMQVLSASISEFAERLSEFSDAQAELAPALNHLAGPLELRLVPRRDTASPETTSDDV